MTELRIEPEPLAELIGRMDGEPVGLIALGIPRCPACRMLPASLADLSRARPELPMGLALLESAVDWAARETLLWPRGIRVTRSCVPLLAVVRGGDAVAQRHGGAPAVVLDAWLEGVIGPAAQPLTGGPSDDENRLLDAMAARRGQHGDVFESRRNPSAGPIRVL